MNDNVGNGIDSLKKTCFVFCHGFGFDATFWNPLRAYFSNMNTMYLDLGYFGEMQWMNQLDESMEYIGIGHSLGLMKLMSLNVSFKRLIGLHGFVDFLGADESLHRRRQRELSYLIQHVNESPALTLSQFYQRTGVNFNLPQTGVLNRMKLLDDLNSLAHAIPVPQDIPLLILGGIDDKIVPPALIEDNFSAHPQVTIEMLPQVKHGLGHLQPDVVYQTIMRFLEC